MGLPVSPTSAIGLGIADQSLLEEMVFGFFVVLFIVAVTLNLMGSKNRLRPVRVQVAGPQRRMPRTDRTLNGLWQRCLWELDVLKTYLEITASKYFPKTVAEPARLTQKVREPAEADRRRWTRHPSDIQAVSWGNAQGKSQSWVARVRDISEGGIGLLAPCRPQLGAVLQLQLRSPNLIDQKLIQAEVMFVSQHAAGEWILGCEFLAPLSDEQQKNYL
ncbi:hypothetical protein BH10PLA2_BH10PLA2_04020 [soil metagenome]